tara:strand:- start:1478 stop:1807 length:330 start_codon:yes stop_codon:yes gene_type:complete
MNAPSISQTMELSKFRLNYFLIIIQVSIILIAIFKFSNTPSETDWILEIVFSIIMVTLIFSVFGNKALHKNSKSGGFNDENSAEKKVNSEDIKDDEAPDKFNEIWDLPL